MSRFSFQLVLFFTFFCGFDSTLTHASSCVDLLSTFKYLDPKTPLAARKEAYKKDAGILLKRLSDRARERLESREAFSKKDIPFEELRPMLEDLVQTASRSLPHFLKKISAAEKTLEPGSTAKFPLGAQEVDWNVASVRLKEVLSRAKASLRGGKEIQYLSGLHLLTELVLVLDVARSLQGKEVTSAAVRQGYWVLAEFQRTGRIQTKEIPYTEFDFPMIKRLLDIGIVFFPMTEHFGFKLYNQGHRTAFFLGVFKKANNDIDGYNFGGRLSLVHDYLHAVIALTPMLGDISYLSHVMKAYFRELLNKPQDLYELSKRTLEKIKVLEARREALYSKIFDHPEVAEDVNLRKALTALWFDLFHERGIAQLTVGSFLRRYKMVFRGTEKSPTLNISDKEVEIFQEYFQYLFGAEISDAKTKEHLSQALLHIEKVVGTF